VSGQGILFQIIENRLKILRETWPRMERKREVAKGLSSCTKKTKNKMSREKINLRQ
jgi:hypothetical protein